jgi:hypothetical protein
MQAPKHPNGLLQNSCCTIAASAVLELEGLEPPDVRSFSLHEIDKFQLIAAYQFLH